MRERIVSCWSDNIVNDKLYNESIILIGPSGAGKSTVAEELSRKLKINSGSYIF